MAGLLAAHGVLALFFPFPRYCRRWPLLSLSTGVVADQNFSPFRASARPATDRVTDTATFSPRRILVHGERRTDEREIRRFRSFRRTSNGPLIKPRDLGCSGDEPARVGGMGVGWARRCGRDVLEDERWRWRWRGDIGDGGNFIYPS